MRQCRSTPGHPVDFSLSAIDLGCLVEMPPIFVSISLEAQLWGVHDEHTSQGGGVVALSHNGHKRLVSG